MQSKIKFNHMLDYFRKRDNLTMEELGKKMGKTKSAVSRWISGENYPKVDDIEKLTNLFNTDVQTLVFGIGDDDGIDITTIYNQLHTPRQKKVYHYAERQLEEQNNTVSEERSIYVVGQSAAGAPLAYGDLDVQEISMANIPANADKAIYIKGDSMEPLIKDGSIVFYKEQPTLENGEIGIFEVNGDSVTCKKLKVDYENKKLHLQSLNDKYDDMVFDDKDVKVLGNVHIMEILCGSGIKDHLF